MYWYEIRDHDEKIGEVARFSDDSARAVWDDRGTSTEPSFLDLYWSVRRLGYTILFVK